VKPKRFYLVLGILGAVLLYSQFVPWLGEHGVNDPRASALFSRWT
jgi:hypothetical protein